MSRPPRRDKSTELAPVGPGAPLCLVVESDGMRQSHALQDGAEVTIGRSLDAQIRIDHASVSRIHTELRVLGGHVQVRDAGSTNGTFVRGEAVGASWHAVDVGALIEIGEVFTVLRRAGTARPRRIWPHGYFEGRVEEEAARCARSGRSFAVLRISVTEDIGTISAEELVAATLRTPDVLATYAPGELEVLLAETDASGADAIALRVAEQLEIHGASSRIGIAWFPRDGASAAELLAHANAAARDPSIGEVASPERPSAMNMGMVEALIDHVASATISVLLLGETGVGKEVTAEKLHRRSPRAAGTLLRLHCAALTETLLESEVFGHERGAFTGAVSAKPGLIESADGGTVFLDEIGELPMSIQVKLLRVLDDRQVMRVGALRPRAVDVRFIAATNRDLEREVAAGRFRKDLYFRLAGVTIEIPPLRERVSEIVPLAREFVDRAAILCGHAFPPALSPGAEHALERYAWPGNVRELRNVIERAVLLSRGDVVLAEHLPLDKMQATLRPVVPAPATGSTRAPAAGVASRPSRPLEGPEPSVTSRIPRLSAGNDEPPADSTLRTDLASIERDRILDALAHCGGNQSAAARMLKIPRGTLVARLSEYGVPRPRKRRTAP